MKKKMWKKVASLLLSMMFVLSTVTMPTMAADLKAAPTEVKSCSTSGFYSTVFNLEFADETWMDAIQAVSVNGKAYTKQTINSFSDGELWNVGSTYNAYGTVKVLQFIEPSGATYPLTVQVTATGYQDLTLKIEKGSSYGSYTATVEQSGSGENAKTYTATAATGLKNGSIELSKTTDLKVGEVVTVTATPDNGYEVNAITATTDSKADVEVKNTDGTYTFAMPAENVTVSATFQAKQPVEPGKISADQFSIKKDSFGNDWNVTVTGADGYVAAITDVKVNGTSWTEQSYDPSSGGAYRKKADDNLLVFAATDFSPNPTTPILKSGDVITITANDYEEITLKLVVDVNGNATLQEDDGQGDPYELHVKIDGSFEAAIVGQKDYDGVSSASTGGATSNNNSAVKVYGALTNKDADPADSDWEELDNLSKISLDGSKCSVSIVPDTAKGTPADADSGMEGVYMTISSALTLNGTPKDEGQYQISVSITDKQGRTAVSNSLPFRIYTGKEKLADQLKEENFRQFTSGLYAWDIMEPWAIADFGSNVDGEEESVRVPKDLEVWYGSHTSGTYGYLGYDIEWEKVESGDIPQTLYIPAGCNLTIENMEILSSVHIIVENGGKLTLSDSTVQGIIDVEKGGTFSMNYNAFEGNFTSGASICGQLRLADGAILENAAIYSNANYLANGDLTDRHIKTPVVVANGNVTVKGQVFIRGEGDGPGIGQTGLQVKNGTLTLADGAILAVYGGEGAINENDGGTAIDLVNGNIEGNGKLIAVAGKTLFGDGGTGVTGNGTINTSEAYIQGSTTYKGETGKATDEDVKIVGAKKHVEDGTKKEAGANDPLDDLYWRKGQILPPIEKFVIDTQEPTVVEFNVTLDKDSAKYDGTNKVPTVVVKDGAYVLKEGRDYEITYTFEAKDNVNAQNEDVNAAATTEETVGQDFKDAEFIEAGTYTLTVTGIGNYEGSTGTAVFTIEAKATDGGGNGDNGDNGNKGDDGKDNGNKGDAGKDNGSIGKENGTSGNNGNAGKDADKTGSKKVISKKTNIPKTGDYSNLFLWGALLAVSCGACVGSVVIRRKRK